jgi:hypothetical protein
MGGWALWPLGRGFALEGALEVANYYLRRQLEGVEGTAPRLGSLTWRAGLGVGYRY